VSAISTLGSVKANHPGEADVSNSILALTATVDDGHGGTGHRICHARKLGGRDRDTMCASPANDQFRFMLSAIAIEVIVL
jgi:hypothetical protein